MGDTDTQIINTESDVRNKLEEVYKELSDKFDGYNHLGVLSDIRCLINKIIIIEHETS